MIFGENGYWGKWNFGRIEIWKNGISESSNLVKCKFGERQFWKNANQEK